MCKKKKTVTNMIDVNPTTLLITVNEYNVNMPIKEQRLLERSKKCPTLCCL